MRRVALWLNALVCLSLGGCYLAHERGLLGSAADVPSVLTCESTALVHRAVEVQSVDQVDLLLMIDDSNSMTEEQASIVTEIPRIVQTLTSGSVTPGAPPTFRPARSLHIGIVSSDMGLGDVTGIATCDPGFGDDGLLQTRATAPRSGCTDTSARYPNGVFDFEVGGAATSSAFAADVACVATLGTAGCGFEHQLEAPLKALSLRPTATGDSPVAWTRPGYRPPSFWGGTFGHGDDPATNGAFLRAGSVLAVVLITDEDDCSTPNPSIFSPDDPAYDVVDLNLRCHEWADELYPIERYVDGFLGLRAGPHLLSFSAITGIPPALAGADVGTILADPAMIEQIDPSATTQILPVCISPGGRGHATPAIRITQVAGGLAAAGVSVSMQSICNTDFSGAFQAVVGHVAETLEASCLATPIETDAAGRIGCDVTVLLAPGARFEDLPHAEAYASEGVEDGRERCRLRQLTTNEAGASVGWLYDDGSLPGWSALPAGCAQRIGFSVIEPPPGADVRLTCCP